jgi:ParB family chromosome partitioning protein
MPEISTPRRGGTLPHHRDTTTKSATDTQHVESTSGTSTPYGPVEVLDKKKTIQWCLDELKEHPKQRQLFGDMPAAELAELAENIERFGLEHPIEILPNGTIIAGHQRVRAARRLGWSTIDVIVRNDLADAGSVAVEQRLIDDNLMRRHLCTLTIARLYRRLKELEALREGIEVFAEDQLRLRDRLAAKLGAGVGGRTLDRYERLLDAPAALQQAVQDNRLSMSKALQILSLPDYERDAAVARIQSGANPRLVAESLSQTKSPSSAVSIYRRLLKTLIAAIGEIGPNVQAVVGTQQQAEQNAVDVLRCALPLMQQLLDAEVRHDADKCASSPSS